MNKERNNKVRAALLAYIGLYNVNLKDASEDIKVDYSNLISFKNEVRSLGEDKPLYIKQMNEKNGKL